MYRATDTKLGRQVALKVLPPNLASDPERLARFQREARAVAALNHPHVVTLYSVEESEGIHFLTMELVEGQSLDRLIPGNGLPVDRIVEIAGALAEALAAAHEKGILHRDLNPANVMVTNEGRVKVLDFGLAKDLSAESSEAATLTSAGRTQAGVVMGTPAYMSPEQLSGRTLDHRSDIFSLGVVLHEMATGRRPFEGTSSAELVSSILRDTPAPVTEQRPDLPSDLARVIRRCLEKDPRHRVQTARDVGNEFRDLVRLVSSPAAASAFHSGQELRRDSGAVRAAAGLCVAVLPFENESGDPDSEYLSDGITETLINSLAQLGRLKVLARSTVFRYKGRTQDPQHVGRELNAQAVLTGRVLQRGDTLVIGAELMDVANGWQLWGERYKRTRADIFDVQEDIAKIIFEKLRVTLTPKEEQRLGRRFTENAEAYELFLKGTYFWNKWTEEGFRQAKGFLHQAIGVDPSYAPAYEMLGHSYAAPTYIGLIAPREGFPKALEIANKVLALDEMSPAGHTVVGVTKMFYEWRLSEGERSFKQAVDLDPNSAVAHHLRGLALLALGRFPEGKDEMMKAVQLEPASALIVEGIGLAHLLTRNYQKAEQETRTALEFDPRFLISRLDLGETLALTGKFDEAIQEFGQALNDSQNNPYAFGYLGYAYGRAGRNSEAQGVLSKLQELAPQRYVPPLANALVLLGLGRMDEVFKWLDRAYEERDGHRFAFLNVDPIFDPLRSDPRFENLLRRVGLPP